MQPRDPSRARFRPTAAFLLTQVGSHAAMKFAERIAEVGLSPPHAGILRIIGINSGISQQALSGILRILPSRLVALVDELEARGLVERKDSPEDRRVYALYLTSKGREMLEAIARIGRDHDATFCTPLSETERQELASLLSKLAAHHELTPGVHPGFRRLGRDAADASEKRATRPRRPKKVSS